MQTYLNRILMKFRKHEMKAYKRNVRLQTVATFIISSAYPLILFNSMSNLKYFRKYSLHIN